MKHLFKNWKVWVGIFISLLFMVLAFNKVDLAQMKEAFSRANYWFMIPAVGVVFFSHWLRSVRWRLFLSPIKKIKTGPLFSALLIGYMANTILPAHLGELLRAYVIGKREKLSSATVFGSIIIERIVDVLTLVILMGLTIILFPFPDWVKNSGYIFLIGIAIFLAVLVVMKVYHEKSHIVLGKILKPFPEKVAERVKHVLFSFLDGIVPLKKTHHYIWLTGLTIVIWACYAASFYFVFISFDFIDLYMLPWYASLVLLVITTISVLVPSSPGYIGTYHYLCQISLAMFGIPKSISLSYAFVIHGLNFFPIMLAGMVVLFFLKLNIKNLKENLKGPSETLSNHS